MKKNKILSYVSAFVLIVFALSTLFMSSSVIFDWFGVREKEGNYVPFIVWTNFFAGFLYSFAAYGFLAAKKWTFWVLSAAVLLLIIAFIVLALYINHGGIYELKTLMAMNFRIIITLILSLLAYYKIK